MNFDMGRRLLAAVLASALLLTACGGGSSSSGDGNVNTPNVVGMSQSSASSAITSAGLKVGTVTNASSASVAKGDVISQSPAAGASVASGSSVNLTVSTGAANVTVPNVVGDTQSAAQTAITGANLKVGTVTMASSASVAKGDVISQSPAANASVAPGSSVNLTVSSGPPPPANGYAYVANSTDATLSTYSRDATTGALTKLAGSPVAIAGAAMLGETRIDPSNKYLYTLSVQTGDVFGFVINASTGALTPIAGTSFSTGNKPQSIAFDSAGKYAYVLNVDDGTISGYSIDASTGALMTLPGSPFAITGGAGSSPQQLTRAGSYLYVALFGVDAVDSFKINADGSLTEGAATFPTDVQPYSVTTDPAGTVLYTANVGSMNNGATISGFQIDSSTGALTPFATATTSVPNLNNDIAVDPTGKYLFVTEGTATGTVGVFPVDAKAASGLDAEVAGSPFSTGGNSPNSISFDSKGQFAYVPNSGSGNVAEFKIGAGGVLTAVSGSPVASGAGPSFAAID